MIYYKTDEGVDRLGVVTREVDGKLDIYLFPDARHPEPKSIFLVLPERVRWCSTLPSIKRMRGRRGWVRDLKEEMLHVSKEEEKKEKKTHFVHASTPRGVESVFYRNRHRDRLTDETTPLTFKDGPLEGRSVIVRKDHPGFACGFRVLVMGALAGNPPPLVVLHESDRVTGSHVVHSYDGEGSHICTDQVSQDSERDVKVIAESGKVVNLHDHEFKTFGNKEHPPAVLPHPPDQEGREHKTEDASEVSPWVEEYPPTFLHLSSDKKGETEKERLARQTKEHLSIVTPPPDQEDSAD